MITLEQYMNEDKNEVFYNLLQELGWQGFSMENMGDNKNIYNDISRLEYLYLAGILDQEIERAGELRVERLRELLAQVPLWELEEEMNAVQIVTQENDDGSTETNEEKLARKHNKAISACKLENYCIDNDGDTLPKKEKNIINKYNDLLQQLIDKIKQLELKDQQKVFSYYLLTINLLAHWIDTKPANMPKQIQKAFENVKDGVQLTVSDKRNRIENAAFYTGVWHEIGEVFKKELDCNCFEKSQEKFNEYRESLGANPARAWKNLCGKLLEGLSTKENQKIVDLIEDDLLLCVRMHHGKLSNLKERYLKNFSVHEMNTRAALVTCCPEYVRVIPLLALQEAADREYKQLFKLSKVYNDLFKKYQTHYRKCTACKEYHKELRENLTYRLGRFSQKWNCVAQKLYPIHQVVTNESVLHDVKTVLNYYKEIYNKKPSDLYKAYLEILSARERKSFKPTAKNKKERKERGSKLGYSLETRCMCGAVNRYTLNALRFPLVTVGRQQEDGAPVAHINLCADDEGKLSRHQFYFKYDTAKGDWMFGIGSGDTQNPEDPQKLEALAKRVLYMTPQDLFDKLDEIKTVGGDAVQCQKLLEKSWNAMEANKQVPLSQIALISVVSGQGFTLQGKKSEGIYHPIFGLLKNAAWLIEINANRADKSIIASAIEKSVLAD